MAAESDLNVLVTGANGFIGRALCNSLVTGGCRLRQAVRSRQPDLPDAVPIGEIDRNTNWRPALRGVKCVVHLAARTHVLRETAADPLAEYRRVNVEGTRRLAEQALWRVSRETGLKVVVLRAPARPSLRQSSPFLVTASLAPSCRLFSTQGPPGFQVLVNFSPRRNAIKTGITIPSSSAIAEILSRLTPARGGA